MWKNLTSNTCLTAMSKQLCVLHGRQTSNKAAVISRDFLTELAAIVGPSNVSIAQAVREQHGKDEGPHPMVLPDVVVKPETTEQVSDVARICYRDGVPMIPFGAGSGFEGGVIPVKGGVSIDVNQMNKVIVVNAEDFDVTVEPGISRKALNTYLRDTGLWFPVDPGADASIGGMTATSASGTNAVRYGTMRENVLNLEVVLPNGTVINTAGKGSRPRKTSAGYNLTNLFVGSEGTLGIFTRITLRLSATPETIISAVCNFPSLEAAVTSAIQLLQANIPIARVELLDSVAMKACNMYNKFSYKEVPTLFFEFHGTPVGVEEQAKMANQISGDNGGEGFLWTKDADDRNRLWAARHSLLYAIMALRPGSRFVSSDVCVPISKMPSVIKETHEDIASQGIIGPCLGHVGDGNFHAFMLFDPNAEEELKKIKQLCNRMAQRAWLANGTCTGEHGIGLGKMHLLEEEVNSNSFNLMKQIKTMLDPKCVMNPGKIFHI